MHMCMHLRHKCKGPLRSLGVVEICGGDLSAFSVTSAHAWVRGGVTDGGSVGVE